MIVLEFTPDPLEMEVAREEELAGTHRLLLRIEHLKLGVRLNVGGAELFAWGGGMLTYAMPVLDFAVWGLKQVRLARRVGRGVYNFPETWVELRFELDGADLVVQETMHHRTGRAPYAEVLAAWERFEGEVLAYLKEEVPELHEHPFWGPWLAGADFEQLRTSADAEPSGKTSLEFEPDAAALEPCRDEAFWLQSAGSLLEDALAMPLRLVIGGAEMLPGDWDGEPLVPEAPLLTAAVQGLAELRKARQLGRGRYDLPSIPETPRFVWVELEGEDVLAYSNVSEALGRVAYAELERIWLAFGERLRAYLMETAPELQTYRIVGPWLRGADVSELLAYGADS